MAWFELDNAGNSEAQQMQAMSFLFAQASVGKAATGVLSGLAVAQTATASGSVVVSAGAGVVQAATLDGASLVGDVQDTTIDVLVASPMGSVPRNDIVVADRATGSIRVIIGAPNVTPTDPSVPSSAIKLARIRNAGNATSIPTSAIDDLRVFTQISGAAGTPGVPYATAALWADGNIGSSIAAGATLGPLAQVFPAGRFTHAPALSFVSTDGRLTVFATAVTKSGFNLWIRNNAATTAPGPSSVGWTAVQMTADATTG